MQDQEDFRMSPTANNVTPAPAVAQAHKHEQTWAEKIRSGMGRAYQ